MFLVPDTAVPGGERVKLLDFGIAKFLTHSLSQTTAMDVVMGTPRYMAPEQCEGRDKVDSKVDVYSLGVRRSGWLPRAGGAAGGRSGRLPGIPTAIPTR